MSIVLLGTSKKRPYFPQWEKKNKNDYAEEVTGPTVTAMKATAKKLGVTIIVPFYEKIKTGSKVKYFNTAVVFDGKGKMLGKYHKVHIPHDPGFYEKEYFEHGSLGYKIFKVNNVKFAVLICYDQWFPEAARAARLDGAEIIFYPTAIGDIVGYVPPEGNWHNAWETVMRGHAIANSVVVAAINRTGQEGHSKFWGQSFVSDAFGKVLQRGSSNKEGVVVEKVDLNMNKFISDGWGFMRNRRPDTYSTLVAKKLIKKAKTLANVEHYQDTKKALEEN